MRTLPLSGAPVAVNALLSPTRRVTLYGPGADYLGLRYAAETACGREQVILICGDNRCVEWLILRDATSQFNQECGKSSASIWRSCVFSIWRALLPRSGRLTQ